MVQITYKDKTLSIPQGHDLLTGLLSEGFDIPHSCRKGTCHSCLIKATKGSPGHQSQKGLRDTLSAQGYFLACQCYPEENMELAAVDETRYKSEILQINWLSHNVVQLTLARPEGFSFYAGQNVTLWKDDHLARSYSLASLSDAESLEFHIRIIEGGAFSGWISSVASTGDSIYIQGPMGDCFYLADKVQPALFLLGTGTGLAPLIGILQEALRAGYKGTVHLFHGALNVDGLYLTEQLQQLDRTTDEFYYHPCVLQDGKNNPQNLDLITGDLSEVVFEKFPSMKNSTLYLCGDPALVSKLKTRSFLAGADSNDIYTDAFNLWSNGE